MSLPRSWAYIAFALLLQAAAAARADPPAAHRVGLGTWSSLVGGPWTVGIQLDSAHRLPWPADVPLWLSYGAAQAAVSPLCDSGNACDARETRMFVGAGVFRCAGPDEAGWLCGGASVELGWATQAREEVTRPVRDRPFGMLRARVEMGRRVRARVGLRLEVPTPPAYGDLCASSWCSAALGLDLGLVLAL